MDLISKKELLEKTGISYGQLYRWKRERLIPEDWFIKRAAFTGQETFLPRDLILPRIQAILDNKDKFSLGELSRMLSTGEATDAVDGGALAEIGEISPAVRSAAQKLLAGDTHELFDLALLVAVSRAAQSLALNAEEAALVTVRAVSASTLRDLNSVLTVFKTGDGFHAALSKDDSPLVLDSTIARITTVSVQEAANTLKVQHRELFPTI